MKQCKKYLNYPFCEVKSTSLSRNIQAGTGVTTVFCYAYVCLCFNAVLFDVLLRRS